MKKSLVFTGLVMLCLQLFAQQSFKWGVSAGSVSSDDATDVLALEDQTFITGMFKETMIFGKEQTESAGNKDIFLARINKNGSPDWLLSLGGTANDISNCLAKGDDCIYVSGEIDGKVTVGKQEFDGEGKAMFVSSFSKNGKVNWLTRIPYSGSASMDVLEVNSNGDLLIGGMISGTMEVGKEIFDSGLGKRAFLIAVSKEGKVIASQFSSGKGTHRLVSVSGNSDGSLYLVFHITGHMSFGDNSAGHYQGNDDFRGLVLVKENTGKTLWTKYLQCDNYIQGVKAICTKEEGLIACVNFTRELVSADTILYTKGLQDVALFSYDRTGKLQWLQQLKSPVLCYAMDATQTRTGKVLLTGYYKGSYFNNDREVAADPTYLENMFLAQFDATGELTWHDEPGGEASAFGRRISLNEEGDILMAGKYKNNLELGENKFSSQGKYDVLLARYSNCEKLDVEIEQYGALCQNGSLELGVKNNSYESFLWDGAVWGDHIIVNNPGQYALEAFDGKGCIARDTIDITYASSVNLNLPPRTELNPGSEEMLTATEGFVSYIWEDGVAGNSRLVQYEEGADSLILVLNAETEEGCTISDTSVVYYIHNTGKEEEASGESSGIRTWPNPVEDILWWLVDGSEEMQVKIELSDSKSVLVYTEDFKRYQPGTHHQLNVSDLASGYYMLSIRVGDKIYSEKIIKK
ncbi:T9SS type A sorting domain-containing protein [uncultured Draconibacterium sp.]|uniref:T9SS type A sorting domain-containing protein n=1 Tax=uncultured Draconibacterium sp. TaxID=1573823 RepID=UPI003217C76B